MKLVFADRAWEDYLYWQEVDKKTLKKINSIIADIRRNPYSGIAKPEPLRHQLAGWWSRRISDEHRMVYRVADSGASVEFAAMRFHYGDH